MPYLPDHSSNSLGGIDLMCTQPRGRGVAQMCALYISLCSNNDVILRARGIKNASKPACILNQCSLIENNPNPQ